MAGLVGIDWNIAFQIVNTIILFLLLRHFLFVPVKNFMDERTKSIEDTILEAEGKEREAKLLYDEYISKIGNAQEEGKQIIRDASKLADEKAEKIILESKENAAKLIQKANNDIALEKKRVLNDIKGEVSDIAIQIASKVVEKNISAADNDRLISEFIENMGDAKWQS
ncbi:MAG: F0F1 ATP synthase subunit B [Filifactoraceae bacterium]